MLLLRAREAVLLNEPREALAKVAQAKKGLTMGHMGATFFFFQWAWEAVSWVNTYMG